MPKPGTPLDVKRANMQIYDSGLGVLEIITLEKRQIEREFGVFFSDSDTILDIGCGTGVHLSSLNCRRLGIDLSRVNLGEAKSSGIQGDAELLPFKDCVFDGVLCIAVLHHLPTYNQVLREAYRVLKLGGRLMIAESNRNGLFLAWYIERIRDGLFPQKVNPLRAVAEASSGKIDLGNMLGSLRETGFFGLRAESYKSFLHYYWSFIVPPFLRKRLSRLDPLVERLDALLVGAMNPYLSAYFRLVAQKPL